MLIRVDVNIQGRQLQRFGTKVNAALRVVFQGRSLLEYTVLCTTPAQAVLKAVLHASTETLHVETLTIALRHDGTLIIAFWHVGLLIMARWYVGCGKLVSWLWKVGELIT